jgi:hypothetical protein
MTSRVLVRCPAIEFFASPEGKSTLSRRVGGRADEAAKKLRGSFGRTRAGHAYRRRCFESRSPANSIIGDAEAVVCDASLRYLYSDSREPPAS